MFGSIGSLDSIDSLDSLGCLDKLPDELKWAFESMVWKGMFANCWLLHIFSFLDLMPFPQPDSSTYCSFSGVKSNVYWDCYWTCLCHRRIFYTRLRQILRSLF